MKGLSNTAKLMTAAAAMAASTPALADHSWSTYHWSVPNLPLTLQVGDNVSSEWDSYLGVAVDDWSRSRVIDLGVATGGTSDATGRRTPRACAPTAGRIEVCNESYGFNGWLGIASIWLSGGHISQGTTKLNDSYFGLARYNTPAWRALVMCQEIGHDLGLDHQDEDFATDDTGSCQDYTSVPEGNEHPDKHDYEQLLAMYDHTHSSFAARAVGESTVVPNTDAGSGESPAEWGRAIDRDAHGRPDTFLKDLGGGRKVITHVFWTPPEK